MHITLNPPSIITGHTDEDAVKLPVELWLNIFLFCDPQSIVKLDVVRLTNSSSDRYF